MTIGVIRGKNFKVSIRGCQLEKVLYGDEKKLPTTKPDFDRKAIDVLCIDNILKAWSKTKRAVVDLKKKNERLTATAGANDRSTSVGLDNICERLECIVKNHQPGGKTDHIRRNSLAVKKRFRRTNRTVGADDQPLIGTIYYTETSKSTQAIIDTGS
ncbi:hypothetical protein RF11_08436 [Thelohanellus kitauei]|uniref:Uncharacterized protein n=1 Tax=Thelohanellus kitauei TaxID=669202 RepID=A0A0C2IHW9_THEKT|nr:hypothetical protein RF11_08436 [Thelohanellus kitauei]